MAHVGYQSSLCGLPEGSEAGDRETISGDPGKESFRIFHWLTCTSIILV